MSIDKCSRCGNMLDTDAHPEVYREDRDDVCLCDGCYEPPCEHDWHRVKDWEGDPGVINGVHHFSYLQCATCEETMTDDGRVTDAEAAAEEAKYEAWKDRQYERWE